MPEFTQPEKCSICGHTDRRDLRYGLAHWRDAPPGMAYEHVARCLDRAACRARVEAIGDVWPLVEVERKDGAA
jgi:hypothetical protein